MNIDYAIAVHDALGVGHDARFVALVSTRYPEIAAEMVGTLGRWNSGGSITPTRKVVRK